MPASTVKTRTAFTLIELLVVVAIIALLVAILILYYVYDKVVGIDNMKMG